jgi:hypothetical protein
MAGFVEPHFIRVLIRRKLIDGRLPPGSIPRVFGGPGAGEICDACEATIVKEQFVLEGISASSNSVGLEVRMHIACFEMWNEERDLRIARLRGELGSDRSYLSGAAAPYRGRRARRD